MLVRLQEQSLRDGAGLAAHAVELSRVVLVWFDLLLFCFIGGGENDRRYVLRERPDRWAEYSVQAAEH